MPTRSENCISALAEIVVAFFGAGASAAAFFAPFFAMLIDRVFGSQGTCKVKGLESFLDQMHVCKHTTHLQGDCKNILEIPQLSLLLVAARMYRV